MSTGREISLIQEGEDGDDAGSSGELIQSQFAVSEVSLN